MGKGAILDIIREALEHLRKRNDPFHEIAAECDTIQRAVTELRKMDSSKGQYIEQLKADLEKERQAHAKLRSEAASVDARIRDANQKEQQVAAHARSACALAQKIMVFHENFRMEGLEKKLGEEYSSLKRFCHAIAKEIQTNFRRRRDVKPDDIMELFVKQMDAVQRCATDREDLIYESCRQTIINFSIYLAAAITKFGPIVVDENTELEPMEFVVEGEPPIRFTVRAKTEEETAQDQAIEYRAKVNSMMDSVRNFTNLNQPKDEDEEPDPNKATIVVDDDGLRLVARHLVRGQCDKIKPPLDPDTNIPINYVVENDQTGEMTVQCGLCKKSLGTCKLKQVIDHNGRTFKASEINQMKPENGENKK